MSSETDHKLDQMTHVEDAPSMKGHGLEYDETAAERGSALEQAERDLPLRKVLWLYKRTIMYSSLAFATAAMFGYDSVANTGSLSMPSFMLYFGDVGPNGLYLPSIWQSLWTSMSNLMQSLGAFLAGFLMDRFGRKYVGFSYAALTLVGTAVQYVSVTRGVLLAGKIINGLGIGGALAVSMTYASECSPLTLRAPVQQAIVIWQVSWFAIALGVVRAYAPDMGEQGFRIVFAVQWAVGAITAGLFAFAPESPNYLVQKGKFDAAQRSLGRLYGGAGEAAHVEERLALLTRTVKEERAQSEELGAGSFLDLFRGTDRKRTLTILYLYGAYVLGGSLFLVQNNIILISAGLQATHVYEISIGGFCLAIVIILLSWAFEGMFRRHNLFFAGTVVNFVFMVAIGATAYAPGQAGLWAGAILMNVLISIQTSIIQGMGWPIAAEISSLRLRGKSLALGTVFQTFMSWLTGFVIPYMYNVDSGNLGLKTGFVWAGSSVLVIAAAWYYVPDTTNLTAVEIDDMYTSGVKPRNFQKAAGE